MTRNQAKHNAMIDLLAAKGAQVGMRRDPVGVPRMTSHAPALPPPHPRGNPAPWAEVVPNAPPISADDLLTMPDDGWQYELVEGVLVRMPQSGYEASHIALRLA